MYLTFRLGNDLFALDGAKIECVIAAGFVFAVPRQKPSVLGLIHYKGLLIPVFNLLCLLDPSSCSTTSVPHAVVFYGKESLNAFPADALEGITEECLMTDNKHTHPFLDPLDVIYNHRTYHQLNLSAIEQYLNIP